jgi:HSP20 family protein
VAFDATWMWRYHFGDTYHERFWRNSVRWLSLGRLRSGDRRFRVETARNAYNLGERVAVEARVLDEDYRPSEVQTQEVRWSDSDGKARDLVLTAVPGSPGLFRGSLETERPGVHRVWIEVDDAFYLPSLGWSLLGGDVFEDESRVVVRLEIPGLDKAHLDVEVVDDALVVRGEKRFERETTSGRYRSLQCAYGSFRRLLRLPAAVLADRAEATYRDGVLKIVLPKATPHRAGVSTIKVS